MALKMIIERSFGTIEVTGESAQDIFREGAFFNDLPNTCPVCGADLRLQYRSPQGYEYYEVVCKGEKKIHKAKTGEHKENLGRGLYYARASAWEELVPGPNNEILTNSPQRHSAPAPVHREAGAAPDDWRPREVPEDPADERREAEAIATEQFAPDRGGVPTDEIPPDLSVNDIASKAAKLKVNFLNLVENEFGPDQAPNKMSAAQLEQLWIKLQGIAARIAA